MTDRPKYISFKKHYEAHMKKMPKNCVDVKAYVEKFFAKLYTYLLRPKEEYNQKYLSTLRLRIESKYYYLCDPRRIQVMKTKTIK